MRVLEYWAWSTNWDIALRSSRSKSLSEVPPAGSVFSGPHFDYCPLYELVTLLQLGNWRHCVSLEKCHTKWDTCRCGLPPQLLHYLHFIQGPMKLQISASLWIKWIVKIETRGQLLVSANRWLRGIKTYRFPWYLTLVSANHASSNPGLVPK